MEIAEVTITKQYSGSLGNWGSRPHDGFHTFHILGIQRLHRDKIGEITDEELVALPRHIPLCFIGIESAIKDLPYPFKVIAVSILREYEELFIERMSRFYTILWGKQFNFRQDLNNFRSADTDPAILAEAVKRIVCADMLMSLEQISDYNRALRRAKFLYERLLSRDI